MRFHFNLYNDQDVPDEEGVELPDLPTAKDRAIEGARALIADHIGAGKPVKLHHRVEIVDDAGRVLAVIPFREVVDIQDRATSA